MSDIGESFCDAVATITKRMIDNVKFDLTLKCTIVEDQDAKLGKYIVSDGSLQMIAYSTQTDFRKNDAVYVSVPNGDYNNQKIILGKIMTKESTPFIFTSPFDTIVNISANLIDQNLGTKGLIANSPDNKDFSYTHEQRIWYKDYSNTVLGGFTRFGIQAQFRSWVAEAINGEYGLKLVLTTEREIATSNRSLCSTAKEILQQAINNKQKLSSEKYGEIKGLKITDPLWIESKDNLLKIDYSQFQTKAISSYQEIIDVLNECLSKTGVYTLYLNTEDMNGNPYDFETFHQQEQVYDISNIGNILRVELYFYEKPCSDNGSHTAGDRGFHDIDGNPIDFSSMIPNLFVKDPYICVGFDVSEFSKEQATLYCLDGLTYIARDKVDVEDNRKQVTLRWIHEFNDGSLVTVDNETQGLDYEVRWYRYKLGAPSADEYSDMYWERVNEDGDKFIYTFDPDTKLANEKIKVIILNNTDNKIIRSNILTFTNELEVPNQTTAKMMGALQIHCEDGTYGNYLIYQQGNQLLDPSQANNLRQFGLYFDETLLGKVDDTTLLQEANQVTWYFSIDSSMIRPAYQDGTLIDMTRKPKTDPDPNRTYIEDLNDTSRKWEYNGLSGSVHYTYDPISDKLAITYFASDNDGLSIYPYQAYYINGYYSSYQVNNRVECVVEKDKLDYNGVKDCTFGVAGTTGTDCTLVIDFTKNQMAITALPGRNIELEAKLYDSTNQQIDFKGQKDLTFEWKWFCATRPVKANTLDDVVTRSSNSYIPIQFNSTKEANEYIAKYEGQRNLYVKEDDGTYKKIDYVSADKNQEVQSEYPLGQEGSVIGTLTIGSAIVIDRVFYVLKPEIEYDISERTDIPRLFFENNANGESWKIEVKTADVDTKEKQKELLDSIYIAQVTLKGWGDYDLVAYKPVPIRSDDKYVSIEGADWVVYPSNGEANYYRSPYRIFEVDGQVESKDNKYTTHKLTEENYKLEILYPYTELKDNPDYSAQSKVDEAIYIGRVSDAGVLKPLGTYVKDAPQYGIQFITEEGVIWTQPIVTLQNNYPSAMLNKWNGKDIVLDEETGTIMSSAISAGKKESDNTFSGVMLGDWSKSDVESGISQQTGIYGFNHGAMSYAFKDDGTAFIGKEGKGRIEFNGNEGTITSSSYHNSKSLYNKDGFEDEEIKVRDTGMMIDLNDGFIHILGASKSGADEYGNTDSTNVKYKTTNSEVLLNANIDRGPYFQIKSTDKNNLIYIGNKSYYLQSNNFSREDQTGTYIDLQNGSLIGYDFDLSLKGELGTVTLSSNQENNPISVFGDNGTFYVTWDGTMFANAGEIAGWTINSDKLGNDNIFLDPCGNLKMTGAIQLGSHNHDMKISSFGIKIHHGNYGIDIDNGIQIYNTEGWNESVAYEYNGEENKNNQIKVCSATPTKLLTQLILNSESLDLKVNGNSKITLSTKEGAKDISLLNGQGYIDIESGGEILAIRGKLGIRLDGLDGNTFITNNTESKVTIYKKGYYSDKNGEYGVQIAGNGRGVLIQGSMIFVDIDAKNQHGIYARFA